MNFNKNLFNSFRKNNFTNQFFKTMNNKYQNNFFASSSNSMNIKNNFQGFIFYNTIMSLTVLSSGILNSFSTRQILSSKKEECVDSVSDENQVKSTIVNNFEILKLLSNTTKSKINSFLRSSMFNIVPRLFIANQNN